MLVSWNRVDPNLSQRIHWPGKNVHQPRIDTRTLSQAVKTAVTKSMANGQGVRANTMSTLSFAHGVVDLVRAEVAYRDGQRCALSKREVHVLSYLALKRGVPVSRDELLAEVWKLDPNRVLTRTIDMHMSHLRRKLRDDAKKPVLLLTINRHGYMLADPSRFQR